MQKRIALLYDFDITLSLGYMETYGLMQDLGFNDAKEFFRECENLSIDPEMDMCLGLLCGIRELAHKNGKKLTKEYLKQFGKDIEYYKGVHEWFDKINAIGKSLGYEIEHYVISSGIKEIIEGTTIAKHFKRIYANFYAYKDGEAFWPSQVVNYTSKTQYIFRAKKNVLDDLRSLDEINRKMSQDEVLQFSNIIYFGDSETDIPSFNVVRKNGGLAICVYNPDSDKSKNIAQQCFIEGRVNCYAPADYTEGSELFNLIKGYIERVASTESVGNDNLGK